MAGADFDGPLSRHVEIDETFVGGKHAGGRSQGKGVSPHRKQDGLFGMLQRGGALRAGPVPDVNKDTVMSYILTNVSRSSVVNTDEAAAYKTLQKAGTTPAVNHSAYEYVAGPHHTNGIEGFWGHIKKSIKGTNVGVSKKYMWNGRVSVPR